MEVSRARKMARPIVIEKPPEQPLLLPPRFAPLPPSFICTPYCFVESEIAVPARSYRSKEKEEGEKKRNKVCPSKRSDVMACATRVTRVSPLSPYIRSHLHESINICCSQLFVRAVKVSSAAKCRFQMWLWLDSQRSNWKERTCVFAEEN